MFQTSEIKIFLWSYCRGRYHISGIWLSFPQFIHFTISTIECISTILVKLPEHKLCKVWLLWSGKTLLIEWYSWWCIGNRNLIFFFLSSKNRNSCLWTSFLIIIQTTMYTIFLIYCDGYCKFRSENVGVKNNIGPNEQWYVCMYSQWN